MKFYILYGFLFCFLLAMACNPLEEDEIYKRPEWLEGKLFSQLSVQEDVSLFTQSMKLSGIDVIVQKSGYFTIFAPSDEAFNAYFLEHPEYENKIENIPQDELEKLVRTHVIQNGWTLEQLQTLDIDGWINPDNPNYNEPKAYKRATILKDSLYKYWIKREKDIDRIVMSPTNANTYRVVAPTGRKFVPFFYPAYFQAFNYNADDYEFYFDRPYDGAVYIAGAKIISDEIPAENGFIYKIDRVLEKRRNLEQIMLAEENDGRYDKFLNLIYLYPNFQYNAEETNKQEGAEQGLAVDSIYSLTYAPNLLVDIHDETTGPASRYTIREQNTVLAPTNSALQQLYDDYVTINSGYPHWPTIGDVPEEILRIIANSHMSDETVYKTDIFEGFFNGESDRVILDPSDIIEKEYGSNGIFLGISKPIVPRAFKSVTGPVYLRPGYSSFMYALELTGILPALKREDKEYSLIILSDNQLVEDSSLLIDWVDRDLNRYRFNVYDRSDQRMKRIRTEELTRKILNQVVVGTPTGIANKEFLETMGGNFVVFDNENNTIFGGIPSEYGYNSDSIITTEYTFLEEPVDNGQTISANSWMRNGAVDIFNALNSFYPEFLDLLNKTGLASKSSLNLPFLTEGEFYTILAPTDSALNAIDAENIPLDSLEKILRYHFIKGELIFTDGVKPSGFYETMKIDEEKSGEFTRVYTKIKLETGPDFIKVLDSELNPELIIEESGNKTNRMAFLRLFTLEQTSEFLEYDYRTTGVIHEIEKVLTRN